MPRLGCSVYYDTLTGMGLHFIDTRQIFRAMGLGLVGTAVTRWRGLKELVREVRIAGNDCSLVTGGKRSRGQR